MLNMITEHLPAVNDIEMTTKSGCVSLQEETLMFSSLNVIEEADYTFYAAFQDHQYKVTT